MILGKVTGQVVGTSRTDGVEGGTYLLVEEFTRDMKPGGNILIVLDILGTGPGENVIVSQGSSARQTEVTKEKAIDAVIVGIIDEVSSGKEIVYRK